MEEQDKNIIQDTDNVIPKDDQVSDVAVAVADAPKKDSRDFKSFDSKGGDGRGRKNDRRQKRPERAKPEFDQRLISIRRVTRVSSGGRRFSFSVGIVVGNRKGVVGVGTGKAGDTSLAIDKAFRDAKKNAQTITLTKDMMIPHEVYAKCKSARVELQPAKGRGIIAGSSVRDVIELAGIKDVNAKLRSPSKNKLNAARATILALSTLKSNRNKK